MKSKAPLSIQFSVIGEVNMGVKDSYPLFTVEYDSTSETGVYLKLMGAHASEEMSAFFTIDELKQICHNISLVVKSIEGPKE